MPRKQTQGARQHALPGCCYQMPILIEEDEKPSAIQKPKIITVKKHRVMFEDLLRGNREPRAHGPPKQGEKAHGSRKRARQHIDDDNADADDGAKRPRLSVEASARGEGGLDHHTPQFARRPYYQSNHLNPTNINNKFSKASLGNLEMNLRAMQRDIDQRRTNAREIEVAEEQPRLQNKAEKARDTELRENHLQSTFQSNLSAMWRECDRQREAAEQLCRTRERERQEETQTKEREEEHQRLQEISRLGTSLKSMWEVHDLTQGRTSRIQPGQLSEVGQRHVREREAPRH